MYLLCQCVALETNHMFHCDCIILHKVYFHTLSPMSPPLCVLSNLEKMSIYILNEKLHASLHIHKKKTWSLIHLLYPVK